MSPLRSGHFLQRPHLRRRKKVNWKDRVRTLHAILRNNLFPTEAAWNVDEAFLNGMDMRFLPRLGVAALCKSWWLVPPRLVAEMLKLLGFGDVKWDYHDEWFYGSDGERTPRMVRHYTVTGTRLSYNVRFGEGWHSAETNGTESWRWSNSSHARLMLEIGNKKRGLGSLTLSVRSLAPCHLSITLNGGLISDFDLFRSDAAGRRRSPLRTGKQFDRHSE
jgi:hypothetical protein